MMIRLCFLLFWFITILLFSNISLFLCFVSFLENTQQANMVKLWVGGTSRLSVPALAEMVDKYGTVLSIIKKGPYSFIELEDGASWEDAVRDLKQVAVEEQEVTVQRCSSEYSENTKWPVSAVISVFVKVPSEEVSQHVVAVANGETMKRPSQHDLYLRFGVETLEEANNLVARIQGNVADVKAFIGAYTRRRPIEMPLPFSIRLSVRPHFVGAIIGRGGENIQSIMSKSSAVVEVSSKHEDSPTAERSVTIKGSLNKSTSAFSEIVTVMAENDDNPSLNLYVPYEYVGQIIGKQGSTIKSILEKSGAKVDIQQSQLPPEIQPFNIVSIAGTPAEMSDAFTLMAKKFASSYSRNLQDQFGFEPEVQALFRVRVHFPAELAGAIIGKGGSSVRAINTQTNAILSVLTADEGTNEDSRICEIKGPHISIVAALSEILAKLKSVGCAHFTLSFTAPPHVIDLVSAQQQTLSRESMSQISVVTEDSQNFVFISGGLSSIKVAYGIVQQKF
eukprot:m.36679 g.36679  ORF g.36679 m.36679 type:complete len:506 (+) comp6692_c0_seq1:60-1577(+)